MTADNGVLTQPKPLKGALMENNFNYRLPPMPQNPLMGLKEVVEEQAKLMGELTGLARETNAAVSVLRAGMYALAESHHNPALLLSNFQDQMNRIADAVQPHRIEIYREEAQRFQNLILQRLNEQNKPQT